MNLTLSRQAIARILRLREQQEQAKRGGYTVERSLCETVALKAEYDRGFADGAKAVMFIIQKLQSAAKEGK